MHFHERYLKENGLMENKRRNGVYTINGKSKEGIWFEGKRTKWVN